MPDNYDRRLMPRVPKEGVDTFAVPQINDQGETTGWDKYHIETVVYDIDQQVFGVVPTEDFDTTYEIVWSTELNSWVQDGAGA